MRRYFKQFGDVLEAVIITYKTTGRSKGYGFVTFRYPESTNRACADPDFWQNGFERKGGSVGFLDQLLY
ncbi:hypothetical protein Syun_001766 [Stephania yunnanensis]|uniref:RRM domain-containing protein n=1 Tax=Stephania yunnanensis TaxID=152371 RepID=A0AAP0LEI0_9MAGN